MMEPHHSSRGNNAPGAWEWSPDGSAGPSVRGGPTRGHANGAGPRRGGCGRGALLRGHHCHGERSRDGCQLGDSSEETATDVSPNRCSGFWSGAGHFYAVPGLRGCSSTDGTFTFNGSSTSVASPITLATARVSGGGSTVAAWVKALSFTVAGALTAAGGLQPAGTSPVSFVSDAASLVRFFMGQRFDAYDRTKGRARSSLLAIILTFGVLAGAVVGLATPASARRRTSHRSHRRRGPPAAGRRSRLRVSTSRQLRVSPSGPWQAPSPNAQAITSVQLRTRPVSQ